MNRVASQRFTASERLERSARITDRATPRAGTGSALGFLLLVAYVALAFLRPFEYAQYARTFEGVPLLPLLMGLLLVVWLLTPRKLFDAPQYLLMLGLLAAVPLSVLAGARWVTGAVDQFNSFLPVFLLFVLSVPFLDAPGRLRQLFLVMSACATVIAWHGVEQWRDGVGWSGIDMIRDRIRYVGILGDPNDLAMFFILAIPMTLYFVHKRGNPLVATVAILATVLMLVGIYLTNSRGGILSLGTMLVVYSWHRWRSRSLLVAPLLIAALIFFSPDRAQDISADEASASGRVEAWYAGMQMIMSHPLFGVGKGEFVEHHMRTAHNSFVLVAAELGVFGYFFWLSLLVVSGMMLLRIAKGPCPTASPLASPTDSSLWEEHRRLASALIYSFAGCLTAMFFLSRSYIVPLYLLLAMILGLYQSARRNWPDLPAFELGAHWRALATFELASIFSLWLTTRILLAFN